MTQRLFLYTFPVILLLLGSEGLASRKISTTLMFQRTEPAPSDPTFKVKGALSRISLMLRNLSDKPQNVTAKFTDISRQDQVGFDTEANNVALSAWTVQPVFRTLRYRAYTLPDQNRTATLGANASTKIFFGISCAFNNGTTPNCQYSDETNVALAPNVANSTFGALEESFAVDLTIEENIGALLGDITVQDSVAGDRSLNVQFSRPLNGGRPF